MKERELARRLRAEEVPGPPAELLQRIRDDIPEELPGQSPSSSAPASRWRWLVAASVVAALGGGYLAWRLFEEAPRPAPTMLSQDVAEGERKEIQEDDRVEVTVPAPAPPSPSGRDRETGDSQGRVDELASEATQPAASEGPATMAEKKAPAPAEAEPAEPQASISETTGAAGRQKAQERGSKRGSEPLAVQNEPVFVAGEAGLRDRPEGEPPSALEERLRPRLELEHPVPPGGSTGGTAEPNDQPYGDVFFRAYGTNPFIDTEDDPLSTFGLDVDTGSYTVVRRYLQDGYLPPPEAVRVEELINYFDYGDPPPAEGDFALGVEGAPSLFGQGPRYHLLRFSVRARVLEDSERRPANLTFVVDVSGSMARQNRLGLVKDALYLLLDELRQDDQVALVVYSGRGRVVLEPSGDLESLRRAIQDLAPEGSTNAEEGLRLAYELAARSFREEALNRVVLCSDGVANVGRTGAGSILERIEAETDRGIELTALGFGMGNYNDVLMEQLADRGNGRYAYIDSLSEARRLLVEQLTGTLQTVATDAKVQVRFQPQAVSRYRLLGYENREIADPRFRDDSVDAGEIGAGHGVTALYEVKLRPGLEGKTRLATLYLRYRSTDSGQVVEVSRAVRLDEMARSWDETSPALRLASLVAEYGEILKGSYWARQGSLEEVFRRAQQLLPEFPGDAEVAELVSLIGKAARLHGSQ